MGNSNRSCCKTVYFYCAFGTPIKLLIEAAGGVTETSYTVISGGPMMGSIINPEAPVTKTTKGILVFPSRIPVSVRCSTDLADILRLSKDFVFSAHSVRNCVLAICWDIP